MRNLNKFIGKTIIVATPGRLWEILSKNHEENENELLTSMPIVVTKRKKKKKQKEDL